MTQSKKYDYRVSQDGTGWTTEIVRRASSKKSVITRTQSGFATEAEAIAWGQEEVRNFIKNMNLNEQKKRYARKDD